MITEQNMARSALTRCFIWSPATPDFANTETWNLDDNASFQARPVPWGYSFDPYARNRNTLNGATGTAPTRSDERVPWGGDIVIRLFDNADGGAGNRLRVKLRIRGESLLGQKLEETVVMICQSKAGIFVQNAYYRSKFAYARLDSVELLEAYNRAASDRLRIGYNASEQTNANWYTDAKESDRKIGIPWAINSILDLAAAKFDVQNTGGQTGGSGPVDLPLGIRGMRPVDLVRDQQNRANAGAVYDHRDNSIRVGGCVMLTRSFAYEDATPSDEGLSAAGNNNDHCIMFTVDPMVPGDLEPRNTPAVTTNVQDVLDIHA